MSKDDIQALVKYLDTKFIAVQGQIVKTEETLSTKLDAKADAVDRDLYATTLGLDRGSKSGKA